jgi:hypothetical protein
LKKVNLVYIQFIYVRRYGQPGHGGLGIEVCQEIERIIEAIDAIRQVQQDEQEAQEQADQGRSAISLQY